MRVTQRKPRTLRVVPQHFAPGGGDQDVVPQPGPEFFAAAGPPLASDRLLEKYWRLARWGVLVVDEQPLHFERTETACRSKYVSMHTLAEACTQDVHDTGWIDPRLIRHGRCARGDWAMKFVPPGPYKLLFSGGASLDINLPALIFMGAGTEYYVWASAEQTFKPDAAVYHAPVPNIYDSGRICMGANQPPPVSGSNLDEGWSLFLRSSYNSAHCTNRSKRNREDLRKTLAWVAQQQAAARRHPKPYPVDDLVPYEMSLDEIVERITLGTDDNTYSTGIH